MSRIFSDKTAFFTQFLLVAFMVLGGPHYLSGQNLVPNHDFEINTGLPVFLSGYPFVLDWNNAGGAITTPDYFHALAPATGAASLPNTSLGTLNAQSGLAIMGFYAYSYTQIPALQYREYIQTQLISPLVPGQSYRVSFWVSTGTPLSPERGGSDGLGVDFSDFPISQNIISPIYTGNIPTIPDFQVSTIIQNANWQEITFNYTPTTPEQYMTVGNFKPDASTNVDAQITISYFFVDNFSVVPILSVSGPDSLCEGDSITLQALPSSLTASYVWKDVQNPAVVLGTGQNLTFSPSVSGTVMVMNGGDTAFHFYTVMHPYGLDLGADTILCQGTNLTLSAPADPSVQYLWNTGDTTPAITVNSPGMYVLEMNNGLCVETDTIDITSLAIPQINLGSDTTLCEDEELHFDFSGTAADFTWMDGDTLPVKMINQTGLVWLTIGNQCGDFTDSVFVAVAHLPSLDLGTDTLICDRSSFTLNAPAPIGFSHLWNTGSMNPQITIHQTGNYSVELSSICGTVSDSVLIEFNQKPELDLGRDTIICEGSTLLLKPGEFQADYVWEDGSGSLVKSVDSEGLYWVIAANRCGNDIDSIYVSQLTPPVLELGADSFLCEGEMILLDVVQPDEADYEWQDGTTEPFYVVKEGGNYSVNISNICGSVRDNIKITELTIPHPDLGNDTTICIDQGGSIYLDVSHPGSGYIWNDQRLVPSREIQEPGTYEVTVFNACGSGTDQIYIEEEICECKFYFPNAFSPNDDGRNDRFGATYSCNVEYFSMKIFDRWGKKLFSTEVPDHKWNGYFKGKLCPEGVYVWQIQYRSGGGTEKKVVQRGGTVTLLR
ncbi:MAG: gliding motility-associated C-terminal domain-containing protein [Bacteroidetes bacterium]|nr:gliding motility-associated C-terminal domain-containing protein [Bacteroidota bacterium]